MTNRRRCSEEDWREALQGEQQKREQGYCEVLAPLLKELSPTGTPDSLELAGKTIARAISEYRLQMRAAPQESLQARRREIRKKKAALEGCLKAINGGDQSHTARAGFRVALLRAGGSQRELEKQLTRAIRAAEIALSDLNGAHKEVDWRTAGLSAAIALQMRKLGVRPVASSDMHTRPKPGKPSKTAGLARLLRAAMEQAGERPPDDLRYFMKKGFELARTRGVPMVRKIGSHSEVQIVTSEIFDAK